MIRILHVVTHMNRGGLETMLMNYYRNIDRSRLQFDFLVHRKERADYDDEIESLGGRIYRLPSLNPFGIRYRSALNTFFQTHPEYSIVHSHLDCLSAIPLKAAKKTGVPCCIAHSHNTNQDHNLKYPIKLCYMRLIPFYADKLFACSEAAGRWMFPHAAFEVLPNAIDAAVFSYSPSKAKAKREEFGFSQADFVIGHVGRFDYPKNHSFLIDIFSEIRATMPNARLLLVGAGDGQAAIGEKVRHLKLEGSVCFAGLRTDIPDLLSAMDAFVFPSLYEGLPVTLIEAQAAGLPCFISDRVPGECKKTELVCQLSLEQSPTDWAAAVIGAYGANRLNTFEAICGAGFDIKQNAVKLQHYYERLEKGEGNDACLDNLHAGLQ